MAKVIVIIIIILKFWLGPQRQGRDQSRDECSTGMEKEIFLQMRAGDLFFLVVKQALSLLIKNHPFISYKIIKHLNNPS